MTPTVARRLLYAIVVACVAVTAAAALLRPGPPPVTAPRHDIAVPPGFAVEVPVGSSSQVIYVPIDGSASQSFRVDTVVPVHGLPGQVGASP